MNDPKVLRFAAVLVIAGLAVTAQAQEARPIHDAAWGLRFTPPAGWVQHQAPNGYLFVAPDQQGILAVLPHQTHTVDALRAEARQGLNDGAGTALQLQRTIDAFGTNGLAATYTGWIEGSPATARVVGLVAPQGTGATILAAATPEHYSETLAAMAATVAESVVFTTRPAQTAQAAQPQPAGAEEQEWQTFLQGCRLSYFNRYNSGYGGGYSDETVVDLCPGYFTYGASSETVFNTPGLSGSDAYSSSGKQGAGQWRIVRQGRESVLQLRFHDGTAQTLVLGYEDGKTFLDGRRWLRTCNPNDSVVEARPQCR